MLYILPLIMLFLIVVYFIPLTVKIDFKNDNICFDIETNIYMLFLNIYSCKMNFKRADENDRLEIKINTVFRIVLYHLLIDTANLDFSSNGIKYNIRKKSLFKKQKENNKKIFSMHDTANIMSFINRNLIITAKAIHNFLKSIVFYKFDLFMFIGLKDAAYTAIINGFVCSVVYMGFMPVYNNSTFLVNPNINIKPFYGSNKLNTNFNCIFKIKCGNIIINGIKFLTSLRWR